MYKTQAKFKFNTQLNLCECLVSNVKSVISKDNVLEFLRKALIKAKDSYRFVIYVASHGYKERKKLFWILGLDYESNDQSNLTMDDIIQVVCNSEFN